MTFTVQLEVFILQHFDHSMVIFFELPEDYQSVIETLQK